MTFTFSRHFSKGLTTVESHKDSESTMQVTASLSGAVRVRCLAQGHLDTDAGELATFRLQVNQSSANPPATFGRVDRQADGEVVTQARQRP